MSSTEQPSQILAELARAYGVATEYWGWHGNHVSVGADTIRAVLAAFDVDASDDEAAELALRERKERDWRRMLPPFTLATHGEATTVPVHVPHGSPVSAWIELEDWGGRRTLQQRLDVWVEPRTIDGQIVGEATFELPADLPLGWHTIYAEIPRPDGGHPTPVTGQLVVVPPTLTLPEQVDAHGARGLASQIYQVRSAKSWGIGDFGDLGDMCTWAASELGTDFVLINPVHAAAPVPPIEPSPYLPTSRQFLDISYIRVEDVAEYAYASQEIRDIVAGLAEQGRALNEADFIDRNTAGSLKRLALEAVYSLPRSTRRQYLFEHFCDEGGQQLIDFATWCALQADESVTEEQWATEYSHPQAPAVIKFREEHAEAVGFEMWLQWVADAQLERVQRDAERIGMSVGVMKDMAVGVHPSGADAWILGDVLARGVTVGAPPDNYSQRGQDWSQPPWRPDRLEETGYQPFRNMIRAALRHSGGVRIDHIIGLFRLWWVPNGMEAVDGTYVRLDHEAMVGILVLEAQRAGSIIVGEDLGTVEPWVRDYLAGRGILGTSIFWFERDADGFKQPEDYRRLCLSSVTTHDLPPTAGYLRGEHIAVRERLGMFVGDPEYEWAAFREERGQVLERLASRGLLPENDADDRGEAYVERHTEGIVKGLHRYVGWTPSLLVAIAVADLVGDARGVNQPGTSDEYPNWRVPLAGPDGEQVTLEELVTSKRAVRLARCVDRGLPRDNR